HTYVPIKRGKILAQIPYTIRFERGRRGSACQIQRTFILRNLARYSMQKVEVSEVLKTAIRYFCPFSVPRAFSFRNKVSVDQCLCLIVLPGEQQLLNAINTFISVVIIRVFGTSRPHGYFI